MLGTGTEGLGFQSFVGGHSRLDPRMLPTGFRVRTISPETFADGMRVSLSVVARTISNTGQCGYKGFHGYQQCKHYHRNLPSLLPCSPFTAILILTSTIA